VRWSVYQFKYYNRRIFAEYYAKEWWRIYGDKLREWEIDVIIPIPLHRKRRRKRGYNQSEILAEELGKRCNVPVEHHSVVRVVNTRPQKELNDKERKKNLTQAFRVTNHWKKAKNVLLIDDIYTTGNTIDSVAQILKQKGAEKVYFLTISIGQGF
jgi:ComF family protein